MDFRLQYGSTNHCYRRVVLTLFFSSIVFAQFYPQRSRAFAGCTLPPGQIETDIGGFTDQSFASVLQPDGRIVLAGTTVGVGSSSFCLVRYNTNGSLDLSFGQAGKVISRIGSADAANAVALQSDGKIVAAGFTVNNGNNHSFRVSRFNTNGTIDASFGSHGSVEKDFPTSADPTAVAIQPDGKILVAGYTQAGGSQSVDDGVVVRYNGDGSLDPTFQSGGTATVGSGSPLRISSMALQPDGKILLGGWIVGATTHKDFLLARLTSKGAVDDMFGPDGGVVTDFLGGDDTINAIALYPNGAIVAVGSVKDTNGKEYWGISQYTGNGSLHGSPVTKAVGDGMAESATAVQLQADGKIVVAGFAALVMVETEFAVARFNPDNTLDPTFGSAGVAITNFCLAGDEATGVLIQPDGKIIATGIAFSLATGDDFGLVRYTPNGSLDPALNGLGPTFDYCLRDNTSGNLLQFDSTTGAYQFTRCSDEFTISGTGKVQRSGSIITLSDKNSKCIISAGFNTGQRTGSANITLILASGVTQTIRINATNPFASCSCSG